MSTAVNTTSSLALFVGLVIAILASGANAQTPSCPSSGTNGCFCYLQSPGIRLECNGNQSPEVIKSRIEYYTPYGPIVSILISNILQSSFSYVPDDFLAGNLVPEVGFKCSHTTNVNAGLLTFSAYAFADSSGACGLMGNLTITDCNIRQFDGAVLNNCNQLDKLAFVASHVESIIYLPSLQTMKNFTVYYPYLWTGTTQRGLSRLAWAPGASYPSSLRYLDFSGNSLKDDAIDFVSQLTNLEEVHLEGNLLSTVPRLTASPYLHTFSMTLYSNDTDADISLFFPNPKEQEQPLNASFYSSPNDAVNRTLFTITSLEGIFTEGDTLNLKLNMSKFEEDIFLDSLDSGLIVNLDPASKFLCACNISWLVRDNPTLLSSGQVTEGYCVDGRPFSLIPPEEVFCCSPSSLTSRIDRLKREIYNLKAEKAAQCSSTCKNDLNVKGKRLIQ